MKRADSKSRGAAREAAGGAQRSEHRTGERDGRSLHPGAFDGRAMRRKKQDRLADRHQVTRTRPASPPDRTTTLATRAATGCAPTPQRGAPQAGAARNRQRRPGGVTARPAVPKGPSAKARAPEGRPGSCDSKKAPARALMYALQFSSTNEPYDGVHAPHEADP